MANKHPADARFLQSREWRDRIQPLQLARHPLCNHCEQMGRVTPAAQVDHIQVPNGDRVLQRDSENLMSLCAPCHSRKTRAQGSKKRRWLYTPLDGWSVFVE
jgi:5-methylcytosine-specific restriction protein A